MRSPNGTFPEYHTQPTTRYFLHADALQESYLLINEVLELLDCADRRYARVDGRGEPQLGRRGLYRAVSGQGQVMVSQMALLWVLNLADGHHSLLDMAEVSGLGVRELMGAADLALAAELIR